MSRIIAGELGGRRLRTPAGEHTRPTSDRVREALFSRVESLLGGLDAVVVLDLYAGSGAVGLEAVSRGAARALLVECDRRAAAIVRDNISALGVSAQARVVGDRVERLLSRPPAPAEQPADLVFADPPYAVDHASLSGVLVAGAASGWFAAEALIVVERPTRGQAWAFPPGVRPEGNRRYGETTLWYGRRDPSAQPAAPPPDHPADPAGHR